VLLEIKLLVFKGEDGIAVSEIAQGMQRKAKLGEEAELTRCQ